MSFFFVFFFFLLLFFLKLASNHDLEPRTLKVELARDVVIPNIYVKLY